MKLTFLVRGGILQEIKSDEATNMEIEIIDVDNEKMTEEEEAAYEAIPFTLY